MMNQEMNQEQRLSRRRIHSISGIFLLVGILGWVGCKKESSVMENADSGTRGSVTQTGGEAPAPTPPVDTAAAPSAAPPVAPPATDGPLRAYDRDGKALDIPFQVSPAKPVPTPAPDPFPARPTPKVVMVNGKIVQEWQAPEEALALDNPVKDHPDAAAKGREWYLQRCADCHGKQGKGNGWLSKGVFKPPTNLASQMVQANSDGELYWKITNGRSPMPASRIRFTDEQRWEIVSYLRTFKP